MTGVLDCPSPPTGTPSQEAPLPMRAHVILPHRNNKQCCVAFTIPHGSNGKYKPSLGTARARLYTTLQRIRESLSCLWPVHKSLIGHTPNRNTLSTVHTHCFAFTRQTTYSSAKVKYDEVRLTALFGYATFLRMKISTSLPRPEKASYEYNF